jgi:hypothetical protein
MSRPDTAIPRVIDLRGTEQVRYQRMIRALGLFTRVAFVAALAGLLLPDPVGESASAVAVAVVIAAPLIRVAWLAVRWYLRGDVRYAAVAVSLLLVVATGSGIAVLTR